ncbi:GAF domain-containing protein [Ktedonosporobacter rubrisoli]|uniref:GAF domain-containing protein n=1 Tax=Ktedonosporobacter rubrisoli TaxID=2509675 RepID=A0A4P6K3U4_KTERU|nr:GAF domain-containing protein [Ktedonosporobacter rubrisoli]QBD82725.1 GAF domain-containing protein [Ktedonosporobacter rubrisoli]
MPSESPLFTGNQERLQLLNALRESELLRELSELLASSLDPTHILQILVRRTTEVCEVERCAVWLLDETRSLFLPSAYHLSAQRLSLNRKDIQAADRVWRRNPLPFNDPIIPRLFEANDLLALEDLQSVTSPTMRIIADKFLARSVLLVALIREGQPLGLMSLDNPGETCHFSAEQQQLARAIGQQAAIAIHNAHLYQQAQSERKRAERLIERAQSIYKVAMAVNSGEDLTKVLEIATEHLESGLEAVGATIALLDDDSMLTLVNTNKLSAPASQLSNFTPFLSDLPHCQEAILQSSSLFITGDQMEEGEKACFQQLGMENVIIVPLIVGARSQNGYQFATGKLSHEEARCVGFAFANYPRSRRQISAGQYAYARDIAAQCALAIEKARILSEVEQAAALATEHANTLEAVFNAMSEGITVLNQEGQIIMSNRTASHFVDMPVKTKEPLSAFLQRHPIYTLHGQLIPPEDFPLARALRGAHIRGNASSPGEPTTQNVRLK